VTQVELRLRSGSGGGAGRRSSADLRRSPSAKSSRSPAATDQSGYAAGGRMKLLLAGISKTSRSSRPDVAMQLRFPSLGSLAPFKPLASGFLENIRRTSFVIEGRRLQRLDDGGVEGSQKLAAIPRRRLAPSSPFGDSDLRSRHLCLSGCLRPDDPGAQRI
jgi:hypothetical protein